VDIRFRDNGCGISTEKLKKIFTVFYSTKGSEGTGLGLAVVHKIVNEHGGAVTVDSVLNEWTEFKITMPLSDS
jgi:signal transduction histidine kinase